MFRQLPTIAFLAVLWLATTAVAAPKIALPPIEGDDTGAMRDAVSAALDGDELTILGERKVNRAFDKLSVENLAEMTPEQAKKLSADLAADAVVTAVLGKKGKRKTLKFRLYVNGKKAKGFTVQFKSARSPKFKTALRDKMVVRLGEEMRPAAADEDEDEKRPKRRRIVKKSNEEEEEDEGEDEDEGDDEDESPLPRPKQAEDEDDPDDDKKKVASRDEDEDEEEIETRIEKRMAPKHTANRVSARIDAGMSFGNRSLIFTNRSNFPEGPKPFRSSPVPGARFEIEMFPFAFVNPNSILAGFGGAVEYDKTLVLNLETKAEPGKKVKVDQQAYMFGGRFRFAFGKRPTSPTVTLGVDYGRRRWKADRSVLADRMSLNGLGSLDLPDTNYAFTAPGLGFRIPIGRMLAFTAYGRALFVSKAGPIQKAELYGKAKIFGMNADAGLDLVFKDWIAVRAMFEITQFGYTFIGNGGELANNRDGDAMTRDMGGARDRSLGGVVTLGVLY